jgi:hypothetical protein
MSDPVPTFPDGPATRARSATPARARANDGRMRVLWTVLALTGGLVLLVLLGAAITVWTIDVNPFVGPNGMRGDAGVAAREMRHSSFV